MKTRISGILIALTLASFSACGLKTDKDQDRPQGGRDPNPRGEIIDLSYAFGKDTVYWVTAKSFERETVADGVTDDGYYYSAYNFSAAEHGGTHIDAPVHFAEGRLAVDQIPLDKLIADAVKIDVSGNALKDRDYLISVADFEEWEKENGRIPSNNIVLLQTGYGRFYPDKENYLGTDAKGEEAVKDLHFPGLHPRAAKWLVEQREINAVGIDTASIDRGQSALFRSHVELMTKNVPAFENLANLDKLPSTGFRIVALPMKIKGGSGGPLRIVAFINGSKGR